jgi:hypothetical protein
MAAKKKKKTAKRTPAKTGAKKRAKRSKGPVKGLTPKSLADIGDQGLVIYDYDSDGKGKYYYVTEEQWKRLKPNSPPKIVADGAIVALQSNDTDLLIDLDRIQGTPNGTNSDD